MKESLLEFKKNIITWYPIEKDASVLYIGQDNEILNELNKMSNRVVSTSNLKDYDIEVKFDYVVIIGNLDNLNSEDEASSLLSDAKNLLSRSGKILLATSNKFGMKYWAGEKFDEEIKSFDSIVNTRPNYLSISNIKNLLTKLKLNYKFYYPLPDYKITNVIYTDEHLPNKENIDSRVLTFCEDNEILNFSEREAYKQLIDEDKNVFPFFANSFFVEISDSKKFADVKFVSFGVTRKKRYRIKTVIKSDEVVKTANSEEAILHIRNIGKNIVLLNSLKIDCLDKFEKDQVISKYVDSKTFDKVLMDTYYKNGLTAVIEEIKKFEKDILYKLGVVENVENTIFNKYEVEISKEQKAKLHFTKNGVLDLTFQNCFYRMWKILAYDQEWFEEYVPIEYILYRAILYFTELRAKEDFSNILELLEIKEFEDVFKSLEDKLQAKFLDEEIWDEHVKSVNCIGSFEDVINKYENELLAKSTHVEQLENEIKEYQKGIADLTSLIETKDVELVNYANQLRAISSSLSWKITKPIRILSWMLNPFNGATFIDRIMPPGGKRRIEYDRKQTEKKYQKRVENYFKLTDNDTAEYWKGIDHRLYLKYEKNLEREKEDNLSDYEKWIKQNTPSDQEIELQEKKKFKYRPKISIIVPLYNTDTDFFRELLYTVHLQTYKNWELCLADGSDEPLQDIVKMVEKDKRIKYKFLGKNGGISENTNSAIALATGDYVALLDHDDMLDISSLYEVVKKLNEDNNIDFLYSDEDKFHFIDEPYYAPHFKPDFAPDTLRACNYICHLSVFKKSLLESIGGFRTEFNGAQDYDIILRIVEKANKIAHISKVLYHWRVHGKSTSMTMEVKPYAIDAGKKAIEEHLKRIGLNGKVYEGPNSGTYGIDYEVIGNPKVSIIIPNKDNVDLLKNCINSILEKTTYKNYEIVVIENNSESQETFDYYRQLEDQEKTAVLYYPEKGFNYSKIINFGVKGVDGDFVVQLNNDITLITEDWLEKMIGFCQRDDVGAVGVKLYYPDDTIQHAGIIVGARTVAAHVFRGLKKDDDGYFGHHNIIQNINAVTAACIMTKRSIYEEVGYMNEEFAVAFNDVDFCLKIRNTGRLIVYNPFVEMYHYESKTRGDDNTPENLSRFQSEINLFLEKWKEKIDSGDEYYNKNLSLESDQYDVKLS